MAAKRASAPMGTYEYYKFIADEGLTTMKHLLSEGAFQNEWIDTGVDAQVGMNTFEREWEGSELKIYLGRKILDVPYSILAKLLHEADETQYKTWDENCAEFTVRFFYFCVFIFAILIFSFFFFFQLFFGRRYVGFLFVFSGGAIFGALIYGVRVAMG